MLPDPRDPNDFRAQSHMNNFNGLGCREGSLPDPFPPPLTLIECDVCPSGHRFFFWFQRGLRWRSGLRRLPNHQKSVSEGLASLFDRTSPCEVRIQIIAPFHSVVILGKPNRSTVQLDGGRCWEQEYWRLIAKTKAAAGASGQRLSCLGCGADHRPMVLMWRRPGPIPARLRSGSQFNALRVMRPSLPSVKVPHLS